MIACGIIAYPISRILDYLLGEHHITRYCTTDLKTLIDLHSKKAFLELADQGEYINELGEGLQMFQTEIVKGAIDLNQKIEDIMIHKKDIYMIKLKKKLSNRSAKRIVKAGYSRIPIYAKGDKNFILGVLLIKSLIGLDLSKEETIEKLVREEKITLRKPLFVHPDDPMIDCLTRFKNGRSHMAIVTDDPKGMEENMRHVYEDDSFQFEDEEDGPARKDSQSRSSQSGVRPKVLGIVTIEDILESIIHDEIYDEADYDRQNNPNIHKLEMSIDRSIIQEDVEYIKGELEEKYKEKLKSSLYNMLDKKAKGGVGPMGTTLQVPNLSSPDHQIPSISVKRPSSVIRNARRGSLPRNVEM